MRSLREIAEGRTNTDRFVRGCFLLAAVILGARLFG